MSPNEPQNQQSSEPPKKVRLWCWACGHWADVGREGPKYIFVGHLLPEDPEARDAAKPSASFMYRHLSKCKRPVMAIYEDNPKWTEFRDEYREYEDRGS
jgi:hypothetical protein